MSLTAVDERWFQPGGVVPVDPVTTGLLVREIINLRKIIAEQEERCSTCYDDAIRHHQEHDYD